MLIIEKVLEILLIKIPEAELPSEAELKLHIEEIGQSIKNYTNRMDIPLELRFIYANMVMDFIKAIEREENPEGNMAAKSIKQGDVTVQFGGSSATRSDVAMQDLLYSYRDQLNKFRKLRW